ncbi:MAG: hypothetical protein ABFS18_02930 [Thermodesulfobacteriota bacterium]
MKKALSFAVALGLVAGMASSAVAADMSWTGDARLRGVYKNNTTDATDINFDHIQHFDHRYRLNGTVTVNEDVKVKTRIVLGDNKFGGALTSVAGTNPYANSAKLNHYVDRAYMDIKTLGGTVSLGRMNASWGNKFAGWGSTVDRIKYTGKAGNLTYAAYLQKSIEDDAMTIGNGDGDKDVYGALVVGKAGDTKWGVIANYIYDDTKAASTPAGESAGGYQLDAFVNAKAGPANVMAELLFKGGDANDNANKDDYFGGFVGASMNITDQMSAKGLIAYYDGNMGDSSPSRDCDNDFAPTLLIGTCNETAIVDFGGTTNDTSDSTYLIAGGADMKVSDKLSFGAGLAYLMASEQGNDTTGLIGRIDGDAPGTQEATLVEVDLTMKYALAQNATYSLGVAYGMVDGFSVADDEMLVIGNRVDVKF